MDREDRIVDIDSRMAEVKWTWAHRDPNALGILVKRLADTASRQTTITYSDLVNGIEFRLPNLRDGQPYQIDTRHWTGMDQALIGDFLGYISMQSYRQFRFMLSAVAVNASDDRPSRHFFEWMRELGILESDDAEAELLFWNGQLKKAYDYYNPYK